jgi:acetyl-CoA C-acetyltransferase
MGGGRRVPVIVGVGQVANKDPERLVHPVELLEAAVREAIADAGADLLPDVGTVLSSPLSVFADDDGGSMVADRLGIPPGERAQAGYSGAGPQRNLARACRAVAAGEVDAALVVGGIADASVRNARRLGVEPPAPPTSVWSQGSDHQRAGVAELERLPRYRNHPVMAEALAGAVMPVNMFALVESALAHVAGRGPEAQRARLGRLLAPFTEVAARRPDLAWFPTPRTADSIADVGPDNRMVSEPYTKSMCSFPTIDLAAAVLVTSTEHARRVGVTSTPVHPWGVTSASQAGPPSTWPELHRPVSLDVAVARVIESTATDVREIGGFDFYSCFPAAVELASAAFGFDPLVDPRPLTRTGGLPYFGGPGASYNLHGIACTVEDLRADPGSIGAVVGVGGAIHDFSVGIYSVAEPRRPASFTDATDVTERLRAEMVPLARDQRGEATVEAMTVVHEREAGPVGAPVLVRLPDGSRTGARAASAELVAELSGTSLVGREVELATVDGTTTYVPA